MEIHSPLLFPIVLATFEEHRWSGCDCRRQCALECFSVVFSDAVLQQSIRLLGTRLHGETVHLARKDSHPQNIVQRTVVGQVCALLICLVQSGRCRV